MTLLDEPSPLLHPSELRSLGAPVLHPSELRSLGAPVLPADAGPAPEAQSPAQGAPAGDSGARPVLLLDAASATDDARMKSRVSSKPPPPAPSTPTPPSFKAIAPPPPAADRPANDTLPLPRPHESDSTTTKPPPEPVKPG